MKIEDYEKLIIIWDQIENVRQVQKLLVGNDDVLFYGDGIFGCIEHVYDIISNNKADKFNYDRNLDAMKREWNIILENRSLSAGERARMLLDL